MYLSSYFSEAYFAPAFFGLPQEIITPPVDPPVGGVVTLSQATIAAVASAVFALFQGPGELLFNPLVTDDGVPVSGVAVSLRRFDLNGVPESATFRRGVTDASGRIRFGAIAGFTLEPRRYLALVRADGYEPLAPQDFVLAADASPTWELTPLPAITRQTDDALKVIARFDTCALGKRLPNTSFTLRIVGQGPVILGGRILTDFDVEEKTNSLGVKELPVFKSSELIKGGLTGDYEVLCETALFDPYKPPRIKIPDHNVEIAPLILAWLQAQGEDPE